MKKFWKTSTISEHTTLKLGYVPIFMKVQENFFWLTLDWFSTNWGKSKNEDEEIWEIFELSKSILGYAWPFMKIWEKEIWLAFHWWKMKMKMKKFQKVSTIFELSTWNLDSNMNFHRNLRKENWTHFWSIFMIKDEDDKSWGNEFDFWTLHPKIGLYLNFHENLREANM